MAVGCAARNNPVPSADRLTLADVDAVEIPENSVIFFSITEDEYMRNERNGQIFGIMDSLYYTLGSTVEILKNAGLFVAITASKHFKFLYNDGSIEYFNRSDGTNVGIALFGNGKSPVITNGPVDPETLLNKVNNYFNVGITP
ncbi:MAG: hypothetical protein GF384_06595 [Elusimicrobia bacterium]|nr:hypothetical protein [Elusimicrobiota bacterium]MBD3412383.1 hypothetical protein [Elusimicrobiota bacterium]